ncbi:MAG: GNAT family N-acetyltransferase [Ignavibacteriales bacterium]|nr:GNAT family N-acetyltransferase [Ignavibacteriales bacterium]
MNQLNFNPFPTLKTERLILRQLNNTDAERIFLLRSNVIVNKFLDREKHISIEESLSFINLINRNIEQNNSIYWVISPVENEKLIGTICLWNFTENNFSAEVGYELLPEYCGKGVMDEALKKVLEFGVTELKLNKIEAYTHKNNQASLKLLIKNNFSLNSDKKDDENSNNVIYSLQI